MATLKKSLTNLGEPWGAVAVIDHGNRVLDGGYLVLAAAELGWVWMPCIRTD